MGDTSSVTVTLKVVTTVAVDDKFIAFKTAALSKLVAFKSAKSTVTETSCGIGVGAGVGGIGVGASDRGVTSMSSVSLVSFMPISSISLTSLSFVTVLR